MNLEKYRKKARLFIFSRGVNEAVLGIFNLMTFDYYYFYYAGHLLGSARLDHERSRRLLNIFVTLMSWKAQVNDLS